MNPQTKPHSEYTQANYDADIEMVMVALAESHSPVPDGQDYANAHTILSNLIDFAPIYWLK